MLSIEQCRKILGPAYRLSDDELEHVREQLYALADITVAAFESQRNFGGRPPGTARGGNDDSVGEEGNSQRHGETV